MLDNYKSKNVTTVGDGYAVELILCTVMGIETALIKERESRLYFLVNDYKDVYRLVRLQCLNNHGIRLYCLY